MDVSNARGNLFLWCWYCLDQGSNDSQLQLRYASDKIRSAVMMPVLCSGGWRWGRVVISTAWRGIGFIYSRWRRSSWATCIWFFPCVLVSVEILGMIKCTRTEHIPLSYIRISVCRHMVSNVWCRLISWRIASKALGIWVLVNSNVVKTHYCRKQFIKPWQVDRGESIRHPKVHNHRHGFCGNGPLPDVAIRAKRSSVKSPCWLFTDRP